MADALHTHGAVVSAQEARADDAGLITPQSSTLDVRTGVLVAPGSTALVTGTSATGTMTYGIAPHHWVGSRGVANGPYRGALEAATTVPTAAAPGSNSRIDVIWSRQKDSTAGVPTPDGSTGEEYGCTSGTAAVSPVKPPIPVGAVELATAVVTSAALSTNGAGVTITQTARQVVARGAPVPCRSQAERDALTAYPGLQVYRIDTGAVEIYTTSWQTLFAPGSRVSGYESGAGAWATAGTAEERVTDTECNITATLTAGRRYRARFKGRASSSASAVLWVGNIRARSGATPTTTSTIVASDQKFMANGGGPGQQDVNLDGEFAVTTSGTYNLALFLKVGVGTGTAAVLEDARGRKDMWIEDAGPSFAGIVTV